MKIKLCLYDHYISKDVLEFEMIDTCSADFTMTTTLREGCCLDVHYNIIA
jgi:hypothetical protein